MRFAEGVPIPAITGVGKGLPSHTVDNAEMAVRLSAPPEKLVEQRHVERLVRPVGIQTRQWTERGVQASSDLGSIAVREAMKMADINPSDLKSLLVATSSPDYISVATAAIIQNNLGIPDNVRCYDVGGNACTGLLQALATSFADLSSSLGRGEPQAVVGVEVLTGMLSKDKPATMAIFGDGAGAFITKLEKPDSEDLRSIGFAFGADGSHAEDLLIRGGGSKYYTTQETLDADYHSLDMDGKVVYQNAVERMAQMSREALVDADMPIEEVAYFIPHQANIGIIRDVADSLDFSMDKVIVTIDHTGNTSAGSLGIALQEAVTSGRVKRNDVVLFAAFGAGFEFAAGVIPMVGLPENHR